MRSGDWVVASESVQKWCTSSLVLVFKTSHTSHSLSLWLITGQKQMKVRTSRSQGLSTANRWKDHWSPADATGLSHGWEIKLWLLSFWDIERLVCIMASPSLTNPGTIQRQFSLYDNKYMEPSKRAVNRRETCDTWPAASVPSWIPSLKSQSDLCPASSTYSAPTHCYICVCP